MYGAFDVVQPGVSAGPENGLFALVRVMVDESRRAADAMERFEALKRQGVPRSAISRRIFDELYTDLRRAAIHAHPTEPFSLPR